MTKAEKIKVLIEKLVEREVSRQIKPLLTELKRLKTAQPIQVRPKQPNVKRQYHQNSLINELIASAKAPVQFYDPEEGYIEPIKNKKIDPRDMVATMVNNPEGHINLQNENVLKTLDIITNKDYSQHIKKSSPTPSRPIQSEPEEDWSELDGIG